MTTTQPRRPDRGWVHAVPVAAFAVGAVAYPLHVLVETFRVANADIATRPGAPFAAAAMAAVALVAGLLLAGCVTMLAYATLRFGRTTGVRLAQLVGLVVAAIAGGCGIWLVVLVSSS